MNDFSKSPLFLNARQIAERLGLSVRQVRALAKDGRIPEITVGKNTRRYDLDAVVAALTTLDNANKENTHAE
ncbi:MAG: helix-turn-helix domain-containing protein [Planctomycetes bacterium]|nr:helix-turn-helix domain-containing protein [Planctomycetota bacterium]MCD7895351.1 helix-turn-helix domain-containing protein [Planctomycetaceae bacterium]